MIKRMAVILLLLLLLPASALGKIETRDVEESSFIYCTLAGLSRDGGEPWRAVELGEKMLLSGRAVVPCERRPCGGLDERRIRSVSANAGVCPK